MQHKLLALVSRRTASIVIAACAAFWVLSASGLLEAPPGTHPSLMFLWLYCNLMIAVASVPVAAAAIAALVLPRTPGTGQLPEPAVGPEPGTELPEGPDEAPGLYLLLRRQFKKQ